MVQQIFEFIANHWILSGLWVLFLVALIAYLNSKNGKALSIHEATTLVNKHDGVFLDIRGKADFDKGHIVNAINIPMDKLKDRLSELEKHKDDPIIVVCNLGHTAGDGVNVLQAAGFVQASRMSGGITEWKTQGLPIVV